MDEYAKVLYDYLESLRMKNQDYLAALNDWQYESEGYDRIRRYLDGLQDAMGELETLLGREGMDLARPGDRVGPFWNKG